LIWYWINRIIGLSSIGLNEMHCSKSMDRIDFQKNLSRGSLFWEGDLLIFHEYVVASIALSFVDQFTWKFGKLSSTVKAWMHGIDFQ
jgi:hypothetical protein